VIRIGDDRVREHLGRNVRGTVEGTLNAMLPGDQSMEVEVGARGSLDIGRLAISGRRLLEFGRH
jgi:hypothetical protein